MFVVKGIGGKVVTFHAGHVNVLNVGVPQGFALYSLAQRAAKAASKRYGGSYRIYFCGLEI